MASAPVISAAAMMRGILRYESRAGGGPMQTSSSAKRTCSDSRSASECTATVRTPSSWQARLTRRAISPRFAIRTFLNKRDRSRSGRVDAEENLTVFDGLGVLDQHLRDRAHDLGLELVHELHRFDDAERIALLHAAAHVHVGRRVQRRRAE